MGKEAKEEDEKEEEEEEERTLTTLSHTGTVGNRPSFPSDIVHDKGFGRCCFKLLVHVTQPQHITATTRPTQNHEDSNSDNVG